MTTLSDQKMFFIKCHNSSSVEVRHVALVIDVQHLNGSVILVHNVKVNRCTGTDLHRCVLFAVVIVVPISLVLLDSHLVKKIHTSG